MDKDARIAELEKALKPFASCVYNDNGDVTVTDTYKIPTDDYIRAYFVMRKAK